VTVSIIFWPDTGDYVTGMPEHNNEKEKNKTGNEDFSVVSIVMAQEDIDASRVL
jgi:hypothetical protein